jgi:hypothetical protein
MVITRRMDDTIAAVILQRMCRGWLERRLTMALLTWNTSVRRHMSAVPIQARWRRILTCKHNMGARLIQELRRVRQMNMVALDLFLCPITLDVPRDPVFNIADGCVYERHAILSWISRHTTSPHNRSHTSKGTLFPLRSSRSIAQLEGDDIINLTESDDEIVRPPRSSVLRWHLLLDSDDES